MTSLMQAVRQTSKQILASRAFGIEIETIVGRNGLHQTHSDVLDTLHLNGQPQTQCDDAYSAWHMVEDKSIETSSYSIQKHSTDPFMRCELVSPKLDYCDDTLNTLRQISHSLQFEAGATINSSCGFHVHFDAADLSIQDITRIAMNYAFFEPVIDSFMKRNRRNDNNRYIRSVRTPVLKNHTDLNDFLLNKSPYNKASLSVLDMINPNRKCHKFNFTNFVYYNLCKIGINKKQNYINTIENRHHHATLNADDMINWISFNSLFVHHSIFKPLQMEKSADLVDVSPATMDTLAEFIEDDEIMMYYSHKAQEMNERDDASTK